jgi:hypothetical protein
MRTGQRSAWRRRGSKSRVARIAIPLAIPMALGLTLGIVIAVSGSNKTDIDQSALGASASPTVSASAMATATASASASASASTGAAVPPAATFATGQVAFRQLGDLATNPVDGTGAAINLNQTAAQAATSMNCTLTVPNNPLSAQGLATPYQLGDGCSMANFGTEGAFVEATILSPNGQLQVYNPLVITAGTTPAATPAAPTIARGSHIIIDVGFNGTNLVLEGRGARQGNCVDASGQSVIGQVSACNAVNFYDAANAAIQNGTLKVPALGTASDGQACQSTRDFALIDQDQSDNVVSQYLLNGNGQTAQNTAANKAAMTTSQVVVNGSDDALLSEFVDVANGCTPFTATDPTNPNGTAPSQALNELSARANQQGTIAVTPPNDEMTLVGSQFNVQKTNVYRSLVDQPLLQGNVNPTTVAMDYCQNMTNIAPAHDQLDMAKDAAFTTPVPAVGNNLATFLGNRLSMSFVNLGCANFGLTNPVTVTLDGNQVATAVTYSTAQQTAKAPGTTTTGTGAGATPTPTPSASSTIGTGGPGGGTSGPPTTGHRRGHRYQNPSHM